MKRDFIILDSQISQGLSLVRHLKYTNQNVTLIKDFSSLQNQSSEEFCKFILNALNEGKHVIPTGIKSTEWLLKQVPVIYFHKHQFHAENLRVCNKSWLLNLAESLNVPIPITYNSLEEVQSNFPVFYKSKIEGVCKGVGILQEKPVDTFPKENFIFQEVIQNEKTYGVSFLANRGVISSVAMHCERLSNPILGGSAAIIEKFYDEKLLNYTERLIKALEYTGWGLAEYKFCRTRGDYVLMEINSKFWASLEFTLRSYPHFSQALFGKPTLFTKRQTFVYMDRLFLSSISRFFREIFKLKTNFLFCEYRSCFESIRGKILKFFKIKKKY